MKEKDKERQAELIRELIMMLLKNKPLDKDFHEIAIIKRGKRQYKSYIANFELCDKEYNTARVNLVYLTARKSIEEEK